MPERYYQLANKEEVDQEIGRMASNIVMDYQSELPIFVGLLRGAAPFTAKLMHAIVDCAPELHPIADYMMISTYGSGQEAGEPHIVTDLAPTTRVSGRKVIVLDDVLDKGITADFAFKYLQARGATSVALATLATKDVSRVHPIQADYTGFTFGDEWLVGMGMDDANAGHEAYRWLEEIWAITH